MKEAVTHGNEGFIVDPYCAAFFREKRIQEALRLLDGMPDQDDRYLGISKVILMMENPSTRGRAEEICRGFTQTLWENDSGSVSVLLQFFIRGQEENVIQYARTQAEESVESKYWDMPRHNIDYLAGKITEADLIRQAGESERDQQEMHFAIGVRQLTRGNRQAARKNFEKCGSSGFFHWTLSIWARAFADRMEKDPTWPDWLPATPVNSEAK